MRVGIDFDNTIVGYDHIFAPTARRMGLLPAGFSGTKRDVRSALRRLLDGETAWMRLQGQVYGALMQEARIIEGVADFLHTCRARNIDVVIISHKTRYGHFDEAKIDLREAAQRWMEKEGFFAAGGFGLSPNAVYFHDSLSSKVACVADLDCSVFIDDLEDVFLFPGFPSNVQGYLYSPAMDPVPAGPFRTFRSWREIADDIFRAA